MNEKQIVSAIIKRHGPVIDLRTEPSVIIDIIRQFGPVAAEPGTPDGGSPPGGAPKPPPPDPSSMGSIVQLDDVMKVLLKVSRDIAKLQANFLTTTTRTAATKKAKGRNSTKRR